ncbi:GNAT family N-acetyltransferase [Natronosalvus halobius]|uniref:GNAT family N-acetyltransferase n=1 Tax=Natronosalvus halobius TaxID=2953746 RepID=UPI003CCDEA44
MAMAYCGFCHQKLRHRTDNGGKQEKKVGCDACENLMEDRAEMRISSIDRNDLELLLAWRSFPEIYEHFRKQDGPLSWEEHLNWFQSRDENRYDFIIHYEGRRVGSISLNSEDEVGIFIGEHSAQGYGVATSALRWLCDRFDDHTPLTANVSNENTQSMQLFSRCGFEKQAENGDWVKLQYTT